MLSSKKDHLLFAAEKEAASAFAPVIRRIIIRIRIYDDFKFFFAIRQTGLWQNFLCRLFGRDIFDQEIKIIFFIFNAKDIRINKVSKLCKGKLG